MSMTKYVPGEVYTNMPKFLQYRGVQTTYVFAPIDKFAGTLNSYEHVKINGERVDSRGKKQLVYIVILSPGSKYATRAPDFRKLYNTLAKSTDPTEVMFVSEQELTNHIRKQMDDIRRENPNVYIEAYTYDKFMIVYPEHVAIPPHRIATQTEVDQYYNDFGIAREDMPKIMVSDTPVMWLGAKSGDVISVTRRSESAGYSAIMRHVING